jgi:hypothetical protein
VALMLLLVCLSLAWTCGFSDGQTCHVNVTLDAARGFELLCVTQTKTDFSNHPKDRKWDFDKIAVLAGHRGRLPRIALM